MARRIDSELLLVGSLPLASRREAATPGGELYRGLSFASPGGEAGVMVTWAAYDHASLHQPRHDVAIMGSGAESQRPMGRQAGPAAWEGTEGPRYERWPPIDQAIASYGTFCRLRDTGLIPRHLRFQVAVPLRTSCTAAFADSVERDPETRDAVYEDLFTREIRRLTAAIPPGDLALQLDMAWEAPDRESMTGRADNGDRLERFVGPLRRLMPLVPQETPLGLHLCYGTLPVGQVHEPRDLRWLVKMANHAAENAGRVLDYLYLAGPPDPRSADSDFYAPLADLKCPDTRVFLGIGLPADGAEGLRRRRGLASAFIDDFGVAMYCGATRKPKQHGS
ncbi:hypothetical protein AB0912_21960 [Streptomyces sp. NPDC007084]|uniref:hypothetical protein n=1 Tax=Streptomyces sp. NPDC007084 TaxID=3154313 RepID=UPI003454302E